MKNCLIYLLSLIAVMLVSCSKKALNDGPAMPSHRPALESFTPVPSIVNVPFEIKTKYLEDLINAQIKDLIFETDTLTVGSFKPVQIKAWKKEPITISLHEDELRYRVPLKLWMRFTFSFNKLGISLTEHQDIEAGIALNLSTRLSLRKDWKVNTVTVAEGYEWLSDPVIKVHFLTVPIKPIADIILVTQQNKFGGLIDKTVNSKLDIKKMVMPMWQKMHEPILLSDSLRLWLKLTPQAVYMTQLEGREGVIHSSLGIKSLAETCFGDSPSVKINEQLPDLVIPGALDSNFVINLYNELSYEYAGSVARQSLVGKSFKSGKKEAIIQDIHFYGQDGYIIVSITLTGSYRGNVYLIGKARYDQQHSIVEIADVDFDIDTENKMHKTAGWLLHGAVLTKLKPYLKFPLKEKLLESKLYMQQTLTNKKLTDNLIVNGTIDTLDIGGVIATEQAIRIALLAKGHLKVRLFQ